MPDASPLSPELALATIEDELISEYVDECTFSSLGYDEEAHMTSYQEKVPKGLVRKRKSRNRPGEDAIRMGMKRRLRRPAIENGERSVAGNEEPVEQYAHEMFAEEVRKGIPFDLKGLEHHKQAAFANLRQDKRELSIFNAIYEDCDMFEAMMKRVPDRIRRKFGAARANQLWHPNMFKLTGGAVSRIPWDADQAVYKAAIKAAQAQLQAGDVFNQIGLIEEVEVMLDDLKVRKVPLTIDKAKKHMWVWFFERSQRTILRSALRETYLQGDVRGPNNLALRGTKLMHGNILFVEAPYLPRLGDPGLSDITLESPWTYNEETDERYDARAEQQGVLNIIAGEDAWNLWEPDGLQWDYEERDYKRNKGIATYRLFGTARGAEAFDSLTSPTANISQGSIAVINHLYAA